MATILKLGKVAEAGSLHEKLLSGLLPLLVPFIAGMPGDQKTAPPLAKLTDEDGLQAMAAAMLFHFPRLRISLIKLLGDALCRWSTGLGDTCCELIMEAVLHGQSSESHEEVLIARLRASLAVLQASIASDDAERSSLKLANVIAAWVVEQLGATYPATTDRPLTGLRLDQRRHLALQHVAWPLCRELLGAKEMARRLSSTLDDAGDDKEDVSGRVAFLREVFDSLVSTDALQPSPVFHSLATEKTTEARAGACLFVQAWMAAATPHRAAAYELLLRLCVERLETKSAAWVLVEAVMYRNAHGLNTDSWGCHPLGFDGPATPISALRQQLQTSLTSHAAREQILALLPDFQDCSCSVKQRLTLNRQNDPDGLMSFLADIGVVDRTAQRRNAAHYNGLFHRVEGLVSDWKREDEEGHDVKDYRWWLMVTLWWLMVRSNDSSVHELLKHRIWWGAMESLMAKLESMSVKDGFLPEGKILDFLRKVTRADIADGAAGRLWKGEMVMLMQHLKICGFVGKQVRSESGKEKKKNRSAHGEDIDIADDGLPEMALQEWPEWMVRAWDRVAPALPSNESARPFLPRTLIYKFIKEIAFAREENVRTESLLILGNFKEKESETYEKLKIVDEEYDSWKKEEGEGPKFLWVNRGKSLLRVRAIWQECFLDLLTRVHNPVQERAKPRRRRSPRYFPEEYPQMSV
eukprot:s6_g30.t1